MEAVVTVTTLALLLAPYPPSAVITGVTFDWSTHVRLAPGSDNWPITWADDDHQYTCWGDGGGFDVDTSGNGQAAFSASDAGYFGLAVREGFWDDDYTVEAVTNGSVKTGIALGVQDKVAQRFRRVAGRLAADRATALSTFLT